MKVNLNTVCNKIEQALQAGSIFDLKKRCFTAGGLEAVCYYIIGYADLLYLSQILDSLQKIPRDEGPESEEELMERFLPFASAEIAPSAEAAAEEILRGSTVFVFDGMEKPLVCDVRRFATRSTQEPEKDRTLRGPHIGLNESLIENMIQIRRYLRTSRLETRRYLLGETIRTEVAILSLEGKADKKLLSYLDKTLKNAKVPTLSMTQESLVNLLFPQKGMGLLNPFPKVRYTERPDVAAATITEGKIAILCDNSPSVILLPECIFDFFEEADDYYFPPFTASYLRLVRGFVFLSSVFLIPIWLLVVKYANFVPQTFSFILTEGDYAVPLFLQFLIIELALDGLKMASLNTPNTLSNSFSVIGGLLLGEFAVKSGWFVPQTILYSAFTGIANYVPTNYELGYSFKFIRISLILLVEFFGIWGLVGGTLFWLLVLISTKSIAGKHYLYPLFPFDPKAARKLFFRSRTGEEQNL